MTRFPAGLDQAVFYSHGSKLLGGLYLAAGDTPRPTALLLHGIPGVEKNLDIAYALRDAGWNCLYFHYRGCWGSQGRYTISGQIDDIQAAADWLLEHPAVDPDSLALVGSSLGGYMTFAAGSMDNRFKSLAAICPLVDPHAALLSQADYQEFAQALHGTSPAELESQALNLPPVVEMANHLTGRRILLVSGGRDPLFPPAHHRLVVETMPWIVWKILKNGDHGFTLCRKQLVKAIVAWLGA